MTPGRPVPAEELSHRAAISDLKHAYLRGLDQKDFASMRSLFAPDATAAWSGGAYSAEGVEEIVGFLERNMGSESFHSSHRVHHPEFRFGPGDGQYDHAEVTWALEDVVVDTEMGYLLMGAAFYEDSCAFDGTRWWLTSTGYRRTYELIVPLADMPRAALTASWWSTDGRSTLPAG